MKVSEIIAGGGKSRRRMGPERQLFITLGGGSPSAAPVYPGETVRFEIWEEDGEARFRASIPARDVVVLNNGAARFA